ncbi:MAG: hypothetical protein ACYDA6_01025 [Solirubrobacteraceae bacterium]
MTGGQTATGGVELFRPVGAQELSLIKECDYREFPPRLEHQPIFYPVTNFDYAEQIARDWNSSDPAHDHVGYVTRFVVRDSFMAGHEPHRVGGPTHTEFWIPAEDLEELNANLVGPIEVVAEYRHCRRVG